MAVKFVKLLHTEYTSGRGSIEALGSISRKRAAVIYDGRVLSGQMREKIDLLLRQNGGDARFVYSIEREPLVSDIFTALSRFKEYCPDLIVAIGGGTVIDLAKALHLFYEHPELTLEQAMRPYNLPPLGTKADLVAIPTTSGTGAETTSAAVFIDDTDKSKKLFLANELIPKYAVLDADFTDTLPSSVAVFTGMDALSHAIEASVCTAGSVLVQSLGNSAALDILENIEQSAFGQSGSDGRKIAREKCHLAAFTAGIAITNSCAGLVHGFDQPGARFNLPHGMVCGMMLPYTIKFSSPHPQYALLAKRLALKGETDQQLCDELVQYLWELNKRLGIPRAFCELSIDEQQYMQNVEDFANLALSAIATKLAPKVPTIEQAREILMSAYYGNL